MSLHFIKKTIFFFENTIYLITDPFIPQQNDEVLKWGEDNKDLGHLFHNSKLLLYRIAVCSLFINAIDITFTSIFQYLQGNISWITLFFCMFYLIYVAHLLRKLKTSPSSLPFILKLVALYGCAKLFFFARQHFHLLWLYMPMYGFPHLILLMLLVLESWFGKSASYLLLLYPCFIIYSFTLSWNTKIIIHVSWMELSLLVMSLLLTVPMIFAKYKLSQTLQNLMVHMGKCVKIANSASETKSIFISNISHELRTPLHAIMGLITLLQSSKLDSIQEAYLETMHSACNNLISIIGNILDLTSEESNKQDLNIKEGDLFHILQDVADSMTPIAEEKDIQLQLEIDIGKGQRFLFMDQKCLSQVLNNLLCNAIKFTSKGKIILKVQKASFQQTEYQNGASSSNIRKSFSMLDSSVAKKFFSHHTVYLRFSVTDTGIGISKEFLENKLFVPFSQEDIFNTLKDSEGSGIGLSLCQKLVQRMGGDIQVHSALGEGTEISFEIPFRISNFANSEPDLSLLEVSDNGPIQVNVYVRNANDNDIFRQLFFSLEEEAEEWQSLLTSPKICTDNEVTTPGVHSINLIILDNSVDEFYASENPIPSAKPKEWQSNSQLFHCYIFVCRLSFLQAMQNSELYKKISLDKNCACINIVHPVAQFKLHTVIKTCISHITSKVQELSKVNILNLEDSVKLWNTNLKVLIAEDNRMISQVLSKILSKHHICHDVAGNGKIAVDMWLARPGDYNIILMDVQMPVMDGFEAVAEIRRLEKEKGLSGTCRIIFNSAQASVEEVTRAKKVGGNTYLIKPLNYNTLIQVFHGKLPDSKEGYF